MAVAGEAVACGAAQDPPDCAEQLVTISMTLATTTARHIRRSVTDWCMILDIGPAPEPARVDINLLSREPAQPWRRGRSMRHSRFIAAIHTPSPRALTNQPETIVYGGLGNGDDQAPDTPRNDPPKPPAET